MGQCVWGESGGLEQAEREKVTRGLSVGGRWTRLQRDDEAETSGRTDGASRYLQQFPPHVELVQLPGGGGGQLDVQRRQLSRELVDHSHVLTQRSHFVSEGLKTTSTNTHNVGISNTFPEWCCVFFLDSLYV